MSETSYSPVLLITFNRPEYTKKVFEKIRDAKVKKLYFFNDGPRKDNENDRKARGELFKLLDSIDWECDVHKNFQKKNLGAGWGASAAITWAFQDEDRLIILEDDCVPSLPFFDFCNHCLEKYKDDTRIWLVSGRSHQQGSRFFKNQDYIFTHYGHSWGWATWKRCWNHFNMEMKDFPEFMEAGGALNVLSSREEGLFFNKTYQRIFDNRQYSWDFRFGIAIMKNGGLSIVSAKNLIQNVGIYGLHSNGKTSLHELQAASDFTFLREPQFLIVNHEYEKLHFNTHIKKIMGTASLYKRIINKIWKIIGLR